MSVLIEVSYGELIDKITILEIKAAQVKDPIKLNNVQHELKKLISVLQGQIRPDAGLDELTAQLSRVNGTLWNVEDRLRDKERDKEFDGNFIELARSVYKLNDERARIKRDLNTMLKSEVVEEKNYRPY